MIPAYLQGKSAAQIVDAVENKWKHRLAAYDNEGYVEELKMLLMIAVKDALCNVNGERQGSVLANIEEYSKLGVNAEQRAIAFLNTVLSKG